MSCTPPSNLKVQDQGCEHSQRRECSKKLKSEGSEVLFPKARQRLNLSTSLPPNNNKSGKDVKHVLNLNMLNEEHLHRIQYKMINISKEENSILFKRDPEHLTKKSWYEEIIAEMEEKNPDLLKVLICAEGEKIPITSQMATVATIYGMLVHCRNSKASALQRLYTVLEIRYHADNKLLKRLNKIHLTLSDESKRTITQEFANHSEEKIIEDISSGLDGKLNGDNVDVYVQTNDVRMNNSNKDYHFFATDWTADRIDLKDFDNESPLLDQPINSTLFLPSVEESSIYRNSIKVMLGRIMMQYTEGFEWMHSVVPKHIPHRFEETMAKKSRVHWMGVLLKNEASYADNADNV